MYIGSEVMQYLQQLHDYIQTQNKKIEKMKQMIEELQQDIKDLKEKQVPSVIKNEYKFDLLKVERLEGTLNIGLNPKGNDSGIGELSINQTMNVPSGEQKNSPLFDRVQKEIYRYLESDAYHVLERIEEECGYPLNDDYRAFILDDIKKQIDQRIRYYVNQLPADDLEPEQIDALVPKIVQKVKRDIEKTCESFVKNLPREVNEP
ncbi:MULTISPECIES: spore germination protein GerPC [Brevibacillus]|uniref:Germination protein PC n=1 Tax=Brevibacillus parabrevis TaxID=54914 RepID=A0A4Y3PES9_BREPA|nr:MULTISPECIES: spore germination protein GerPC [Brevibacillus]MDH6349737.1 spore germination protein PC [Brevibacillus sp. 1238]MDR4999192.1 spore germination protein GerPC [Brevibacillus parabrevis]MED2254251.1 spore germination protein GerPC [Brevibacillus parabrevis]NRQ54732.1 spore gernimation protein [Brevibacillus sp. HD1.4A]RNB94083.1 spore gernimation protein [Brevibacillus parabrevis]